MKKIVKKISTVLLSGLFLGVFAAPTHVHAEENIELLPLEADEYSSLETKTARGVFVYRKSLGTISSGISAFSLTAVLHVNQATGVIESAELAASGSSEFTCLYNMDLYDYEVYFTVTVYDHNIFGNIDHALVTKYYTVETPGIMR